MTKIDTNWCQKGKTMDTNETKNRFYFWGDGESIQSFEYLSEAYDARRAYAANHVTDCEGIRIGLFYLNDPLGICLVDIENTFDGYDDSKLTDDEIMLLKRCDEVLQKEGADGAGGNRIYNILINHIGKRATAQQYKSLASQLN